MSQLASTLLGAVAGALLAYLFGYFHRVRSEFEEESAPLHDVKRELASARQKIVNFLETSRLWSDHEELSSNSWDTHGGQLSSRFGDGDRAELQGIFALFHSADLWVQKLRQLSREKSENDVPPAFVASLRTLKTKIDGDEKTIGAIAILDKKLASAESRQRKRRFAGFAMVALVAAAIVVPTAVSYIGRPAVTEASLSRQLHEQFPASSRAICDESSIFDGAYRCAIEFPSCHGHLEAAIEGPPCSASGPRVDVAKVYADDDCYEATMFERILNELPSSQSETKPRKDLTSSGCVKG